MSSTGNSTSRTVVSDGIAEDLIRSFVQVGCAEVHMKTLIEKTNSELENGIAEDFQAQSEKLNELVEEANNLAELRRSIMLRLFNMYDGDKDYWCVVKHLGIGAFTLFEAYEASEDDPALLELALEANKRFIKAMCRFLGTEIVDCAACFADILKGEKHEQ